MKRIRTALIIMAALVAAAAAVFLIADKIKSDRDAEEKSKQDELLLFSFDEDSIESIDIENSSGKYTARYEQSAGWTVTGLEGFKPDDAALAAVSANISSLRAEKLLDTTDKSKCGFDDPVTITAHTDGQDYTLVVGDPSPTNDYYYVMKKDSDKIFLVNYVSGKALDLEKNGLKSLYPYSYYTYEVKSFSLWKGREDDKHLLFTMEKDGEKWGMTKPFKDNSVANSDIDEYLSSVVRDEVTEYLEENCKKEDYPKYGFDDPQYVFEINTDKESQKVIFGKQTEDGQSTYALITSNGQVAKFGTATATALGKTTLNMMDPKIYAPDISNVKSIDAVIGGESVRLGVQKGSYELDGEKVPEDAQTDFISFYSSMLGISASSIDREHEPSGEAALTIRYTLSDDSEKEVSYIMTEDEKGCMALRDGKYTGLVVEKERIDNVIKNYETVKEAMK